LPWAGMLRPFRATIFNNFNPGRCPGLVCYALSGLQICLLKILMQSEIKSLHIMDYQIF